MDLEADPTDAVLAVIEDEAPLRPARPVAEHLGDLIRVVVRVSRSADEVGGVIVAVLAFFTKETSVALFIAAHVFDAPRRPEWALGCDWSFRFQSSDSRIWSTLRRTGDWGIWVKRSPEISVVTSVPLHK